MAASTESEQTIQEEILELTKDLVEFKTVKGHDKEFEKAFSYIENYFEDSDYTVYTHRINGFESKVISTVEDPEIILHGHIDVVDAKEKKMFNPKVEDEKIYGRGAADMKSGLAALMCVLKNTEPPSVGLMVTSDEEIGGFNGAKPLSKEYNPNFVISAEPNNTESYMEIIAKQKGVVRAEIISEGKNAHGSRPWNGENAAEKLWEKYSKLKKNFSTEKENWGTTVNLGNFNAGGAANVVPDKASAKLDIRYTQSYTPEEIKDDIENIEGLKCEFNAVDPMLNTNKDNSFVQILKEASEEAIGESVAVSKKEPASDVRHFSENGVPGVVFGPEGYHVHENGEYAVISSFKDFYDSINLFLRKIS